MLMGSRAHSPFSTSKEPLKITRTTKRSSGGNNTELTMIALRTRIEEEILMERFDDEYRRYYRR